MIQTILPILQTLLAFANICIIGYGLFNFLKKPHTELEDKVKEHDIKIKEIEKALLRDNDRFHKHDDTDEVILSCMLALIDFELAYCIHTSYEDTEDLKKERTELRTHLARK